MIRTVSSACIARLCVLFLSCAGAVAAEPEGPRPLEIHVDATEAPRRLLHARLVIPAAPGPLTLYYPKWIPGEHAPNGPIADLAGITIRAAGKTVNWRRDDVDLYALHLTVPEGVDRIEVSLDYLGPSPKDTYTACALTPRLAMLNWHAVVLYPKGRPVRELPVRAELTLPKGWKLGTALPIESTRGAVTQFRTVALETLVDSPVLCGAHLKEVPLGGPEGRPHFLVLACEGASGLEMSAALKKHFERLVVEGGALFKTYPYRSYRFLVAMSDNIAPEGIERRESSENRVPERFLVESSYRKQDVGWLLPHEFVHAWNGKYRRSKGLTPTDYQQPLQTRMLWVYGADPLPGLRSNRALRAVHPGAGAVEVCPDQRWSDVAAGRAQVASPGRHGRGRTASVWRSLGLGTPAPRRRLLRRGRLAVVRYRYAHSRKIGRQEEPGRLLPCVLPRRRRPACHKDL